MTTGDPAADAMVLGLACLAGLLVLTALAALERLLDLSGSESWRRAMQRIERWAER